MRNLIEDRRLSSWIGTESSPVWRPCSVAISPAAKAAAEACRLVNITRPIVKSLHSFGRFVLHHIPGR
jgi:hypothetical protein